MSPAIARCSACGDCFHDDGMGWDLCHSCRVHGSEPVLTDAEKADPMVAGFVRRVLRHEDI